MLDSSKYAGIINELNTMIRRGDLLENLQYVSPVNDSDNSCYHEINIYDFMCDLIVAEDDMTQGEIKTFIELLRQYQYYLSKIMIFNFMGVYDSTHSIFESRLINFDWVLGKSTYGLGERELVSAYSNDKVRATDKIVMDDLNKFNSYLKEKNISLSVMDDMRCKDLTLFNILEVPLKSKIPFKDSKAMQMWCQKAHQYITEHCKIAILLNYGDKFKHLLVEENINGVQYYRLRDNSMEEVDKIAREYVNALNVLDSINI